MVAVRRHRPIAWGCPAHSIANNFLHNWIIICRISFVARLEIKDLPCASGKGAAAAEDLTSLEPA